MGAHLDVGGTRQWIGCPLRVHRRCLDPMFSVANKIAYDHKMVNTRANEVPTAVRSLWYHVIGETTDKQYVSAQGDVLLRLFSALYKHNEGLPNLYIITPFKRIKRHVQTLIRNPKNWRSALIGMPLPNETDLKKWCHRNIGTVHTFQGKEIETVIFILGVDKTKQGAANWASSKPNLLNVALTRAKDNIYIIGDYTLWSKKPYFSELARVLPRIDV